MRDYAKVAPQFWTGTTGRALRAEGRDCQLLALYLITSPHATMIGLYYMPLPLLCHETGLSREGASKALRSLGALGFAHYDPERELVWVPEMARFQLGRADRGGGAGGRAGDAGGAVLPEAGGDPGGGWGDGGGAGGAGVDDARPGRAEPARVLGERAV